METIYIYDAGTARLVVCQVGADSDLEEEAERIAERGNMRWNDCAWGGVDRLDIEVVNI